MGEASGFTQYPGVLQSLPDAEAFVRVEDNQLTDLQVDNGEQSQIQTACRDRNLIQVWQRSRRTELIRS